MVGGESSLRTASASSPCPAGTRLSTPARYSLSERARDIVFAGSNFPVARLHQATAHRGQYRLEAPVTSAVIAIVAGRSDRSLHDAWVSVAPDDRVVRFPIQNLGASFLAARLLKNHDVLSAIATARALADQPRSQDRLASHAAFNVGQSDDDGVPS